MLDHLGRFVEVHVVVGPHEAEVIVGLARWPDRARSILEKIGRFIIKAGLFGRGAIIEIESCVEHFAGVQLRFVERFLEDRDRFLRAFGLAQGQPEVIGELRRARETATRFGEKFHRAFASP